MMQLLCRQVTGNEQQMVTENRYICSCILCWGLGYSSQSCIIYVQGLEAAVDHGEDDALGIMQHLHEQSASAYCEAEEVLARPPPPAVSVECMASPLSGYQAQSDANPNPHDCKENMRVGSDDIDLGTSASVNWFSPFHVDFLSPNGAVVAGTPPPVWGGVGSSSVVGLNGGSDENYLASGGACDPFSPSMYLLKECR
jgi:hypothetical protein